MVGLPKGKIEGGVHWGGGWAWDYASSPSWAARMGCVGGPRRLVGSLDKRSLVR